MCNMIGAIATALYLPIANNYSIGLVIATVLVLALIIAPDFNKEDNK